MKDVRIEKIIRQLINSTNKFDIGSALKLFAANAVIEDVSVGEQFKNTEGVRKYIEQFFVGYHTVTKLESIRIVNEQHAIAHVDFTGDFGHETGGLDIMLNSDGLIKKIGAYLD